MGKRLNDNGYNNVCVCAFRVLNGEIFFKSGKIQLVQDEQVISVVKNVVNGYIYYYDNYPINFVCSSGVFFVCVNLHNDDNEYDVLKFVTRVVYQIQKYLLQNLHLVVSGCIKKGKCLLADKTKVCLNGMKIALDIESCSVLAQPYIFVDNVDFSAMTNRLVRDNHLFKTVDNLYVINYFRFSKDVVSMQFVIDYITKSKRASSKQILLFKDMFDKSCAKLKVDVNNT